MLAERVQEWTREWVEQGRTEGREQGRTEERKHSLAAERTLLRRQATRKFEAATADQLVGAIADMNDPERLAEVGEAIIDCNTASDLIERIRIVCRQDAAEDQH